MEDLLYLYGLAVHTSMKNLAVNEEEKQEKEEELERKGGRKKKGKMSPHWLEFLDPHSGTGGQVY